MMKNKITKLATIAVFNFIVFNTNIAIATDYDIGPNQSLTSLNEVPWLDLQAGDNVNIHYRPEPYRTKIGLHARGTETAPITIRGILGPNGELPTISGENATTPANLNGFFSEKWDENLAVFLIKRARSDSYFDYKPGHITIENLRIVDAFNENTFTDSKGNTRNYSAGAGGIWAVLVENLIVRNCEITKNGNGLFILSKSDENNISRNILVENNKIYDNGVPGSDRQHNIYTQAATITFQYNELGQLRDGAKGSTLKDRSSNTTIRYNKILSSARALDLVDPEDGGNVIAFEPGFHNTYVYGNLILNDHSNKQKFASANMIHYGGDSGQTDLYRKGKLHFFNNTVVVKANKTDVWRMRLFDLATNDETVVLQNNIFYRQGDTNFLLMNNHGIAEVKATNWISKGWHEGREESFNGTVNQLANGFIETDSHPFVSVENDNYLLRSGSSCVDSGVELPTNLPALNAMYKNIASKTDRTILGSSIDLGAFEGEVQTENNETPEISEPTAPESPVTDNSDPSNNEGDSNTETTGTPPTQPTDIYQIQGIVGQSFSFNMADANTKVCRQGAPDYPKIEGLPAGVYRSGCTIYGKAETIGVSRLKFPVEEGEWIADLIITSGTSTSTSPYQIQGVVNEYFDFDLTEISNETCRQGFPDYPKVTGLPDGIYRSGCAIYGTPINPGVSRLTFPIENGIWTADLIITGEAITAIDAFETHKISTVVGQFFSFNMSDVNDETCRQGYPDYPKITGLPTGVYKSGCTIYGRAEISGTSHLSFPIEGGEWFADLEVTDLENLPETDSNLPDSSEIHGTKGQYLSYDLEEATDQVCRQGYPDYPKLTGLPAGIYRSGCTFYGTPENSGTSQLTFPVEGGEWVTDLVISE